MNKNYWKVLLMSLLLGNDPGCNCKKISSVQNNPSLLPSPMSDGKEPLSLLSNDFSSKITKGIKSKNDDPEKTQEGLLRLLSNYGCSNMPDMQLFRDTALKNLGQILEIDWRYFTSEWMVKVFCQLLIESLGNQGKNEERKRWEELAFNLLKTWQFQADDNTLNMLEPAIQELFKRYPNQEEYENKFFGFESLKRGYQPWLEVYWNVRLGASNTKIKKTDTTDNTEYLVSGLKKFFEFFLNDFEYCHSVIEKLIDRWQGSSNNIEIFTQLFNVLSQKQEEDWKELITKTLGKIYSCLGFQYVIYQYSPKKWVREKCQKYKNQCEKWIQKILEQGGHQISYLDQFFQKGIIQSSTKIGGKNFRISLLGITAYWEIVLECISIRSEKFDPAFIQDRVNASFQYFQCLSSEMFIQLTFNFIRNKTLFNASISDQVMNQIKEYVQSHRKSNCEIWKEITEEFEKSQQKELFLGSTLRALLSDEGLKNDFKKMSDPEFQERFLSSVLEDCHFSLLNQSLFKKDLDRSLKIWLNWAEKKDWMQESINVSVAAYILHNKSLDSFKNLMDDRIKKLKLPIEKWERAYEIYQSFEALISSELKKDTSGKIQGEELFLNETFLSSLEEVGDKLFLLMEYALFSIENNATQREKKIERLRILCEHFIEHFGKNFLIKNKDSNKDSNFLKPIFEFVKIYVQMIQRGLFLLLSQYPVHNSDEDQDAVERKAFQELYWICKERGYFNPDFEMKLLDMGEWKPKNQNQGHNVEKKEEVKAEEITQFWLFLMLENYFCHSFLREVKGNQLRPSNEIQLTSILKKRYFEKQKNENRDNSEWLKKTEEEILELRNNENFKNESIELVWEKVKNGILLKEKIYAVRPGSYQKFQIDSLEIEHLEKILSEKTSEEVMKNNEFFLSYFAHIMQNNPSLKKLIPDD